MKIQFSLPTDEGFFNRYATLTPTPSKLGVIAQIISGLTEVGIFYSLIFSRIVDFVPNYAAIIATIGAIIGTAFLEIGLRKFTPYSVNAFLNKRFTGLDSAMTIFILLVTMGLFITSGTLSFQGSKEMVSIAQPTPKLKSTEKTDKEYSLQKAEYRNTFSLDSNTISSGYNKQISAKSLKYQALVKQQQSKLNQFLRKEERTGLSYQTKKESIKGNMASLEAEKANTIGELEALQANELKTLTNNRNDNLKTSEERYLATIQAFTKENNKINSKAENTTLFYGNGLAWFTIICMCVFLLSVVIGEIHKKGSGIEQVAVPNQYHFSQSVFSEFSNMIGEKINYKLRDKIKTLAEKTPPPPLPSPPPSLYDLANAKKQRLTFEIEENKNLKYFLANPLPVIDETKIIAKNGSTTSKNMADVATPIFKEKTLEKTIIRKSYNEEKTKDYERICLHCSKPYIYRHHKQKYCCDECRINAWQKKTGKQLKLKKKK